MFDQIIQTVFHGRRSSFAWGCATMVAFVAVIFSTGGAGALAYILGAVVIVLGWSGELVIRKRAARSRPPSPQPEAPTWE